MLKKIYFGPSLVNLARTCDELSRRQARDWRTQGHTQAMTIPKAKNWHQVKIASWCVHEKTIAPAVDYQQAWQEKWYVPSILQFQLDNVMKVS